jgi:MoaA/NifB/PqqE/SkfB family radical SAM enzyme
MSYRALTARAAHENLLHTVLFELTYRCNLNCFFCYNDLSLAGRGLGDGDYFRLLEELAEMQVMHVTLSGGEPLASPSFWPVGRKARELGFIVRVKSNAHAMNAATARRLREEVDPFVVETSLHGATPEVHDRQTRVPGSFARLVANLEAMRAAGLRVKANATLTRWNEGHVGAMFALADGLGVRLTFDPVVTPRDDGDRGPLAISASAEGVERLFRLLGERRRARQAAGLASESELGRHQDTDLPATSGVKNCGTGSSTLAVDPYGNVYPCVQWRRPVGNVHERTLSEIWGGSPELDEVRTLALEAGRRVDARGPLGRGMGFCLGLAEELTGDPLGVYPQAERNFRTLERIELGGKTALPVLVG